MTSLPYIKACIIAFALVALFLHLPTLSYAQTTPIYIVGTGTSPTLDGVWQPGEWDNGVELKIGYGPDPSLAPAYIRFVHDQAFLYFIYDVPFDTTPSSGSTPQLPLIVLVFDGNANGFSHYDLNDCEIIAEVTSSGGMAIDYVGSNDTSYHPYLGQALHEIQIAQSMGPSPHSATPHRIWEGKIPLQPLTLNSPKAPDLSPVIGFNTEVQDALGNSEQLQPTANTYSVSLLELAAYPVPENLNLITPFLLTLTVLAVYTVLRSRRLVPGASSYSR